MKRIDDRAAAAARDARVPARWRGVVLALLWEPDRPHQEIAESMGVELRVVREADALGQRLGYLLCEEVADAG